MLKMYGQRNGLEVHEARCGAAIARLAGVDAPRRRPPNARARTRSAPHAFSRVDAATTPRVGLKSFPQTLPLHDHEVVLTFDDGPWPATDAEGAGGAGA